VLYIDYSECKMSEGTSKSGGFNYINHVVTMLNDKEIKVVLIIPSGFSPTDDENKLFTLKNVTTVKIDSLANIKMESNATLFIPLLPVAKLSIIDKIKKNNPNSKVYITIHGVRRLDLKYDKYDKYYFEGIRKELYPIIARLSYYIGNVMYRREIKKHLNKYDKVFTVSNNTMQQLIKLGSPKHIKWFYQGANISEIDKTKGENNNSKEKYILFVSGNRSEKNLLRFMIAFLKYKRENESDNLLYVTGINETRKNTLLQCKELDKLDVFKWVKFFGYVDDDVLDELYFNAQYIAYPSKSEGFGLPVQEAIMRGKPVLASYVTAIPEVVDSSICYMNPFSVDSIVMGLRKMTQKELERQILAIKEKEKIVIDRIELCNNDLAFELTENEVQN